MKRRRDLEGEALWAIVAGTVRAFPGRRAPATPALGSRPAVSTRQSAPERPLATAARRSRAAAAEGIEPGRLRRLVSGREALGGRIDLHGMGQDEARAVLTAFVLRGLAKGICAILVITGKGALGDGVLRRRVPEWLVSAPLRDHVAGFVEAHRRHGGAGALYVALRRR